MPTSERKKRRKKLVTPLVDAFSNWFRDSLRKVTPSPEIAKGNELNIHQYFKQLLIEIPKHMDDTNFDFLENCSGQSKL